MLDFKFDNVQKMSFCDIKKLELVNNGDVGSSSKVYKLNDKECIKLFNESKDIFELKRYSEYTKLDFSCAALPKTLYLINNKFRAVKTDFVNGIMLSEIDCEIEYSKFLILSKQLLDASKEINEEGIMIFDSHSDNIMYNYDEDKFVLIDQGEWSQHRVDTLYASTMNFGILHDTIRSVLFKNAFSIGNQKKSFDIDGDFIDYYEIEREILQRKTGQKIKTIGDFRKAIR